MTDTLEYLTTPAGAILTVLGIGPSILLLVLLAPRSLRRNSQEGFEKKDGRWLRASPLVVNGSKPVRLLYREESRENGDSGWRVLSGDEAEDFLKDPTRLKRLQLDDFLRREPAVRALLDEPAGTAFLRDEGSATFRRVRSVAARLIDG